MRKTITGFMLGAVLLLPAAAAAQKVTAKDVPEAVRSSFSAAYPHSKVLRYRRGTMDGEPVYAVESREGKMRRAVLYAADGTTVEMKERVAPEALPEAVRRSLKDRYPQGQVKSAERITRGERVRYEVRLREIKKTHKVLLNPDGGIVREEIE